MKLASNSSHRRRREVVNGLDVVIPNHSRPHRLEKGKLGRCPLKLFLFVLKSFTVVLTRVFTSLEINLAFLGPLLFFGAKLILPPFRNCARDCAREGRRR